MVVSRHTNAFLLLLLGGWGTKKDSKGQLVDGPRDKWKPDLKVVKATIRFFEQTGRLTYRPKAVETY
jgi:hypothetical protein